MIYGKERPVVLKREKDKKKKIVKSILVGIVAASLALGLLPGNLAVKLGIATESKAAGGYQIIEDPHDVSKVTALLPVGCTWDDVLPYVNQALKDGKIIESTETMTYWYLFSLKEAGSTNLGEIGQVGTNGFYYEAGHLLSYDNNSLSDYKYDGATGQPSGDVYFIFLINASTGNIQETVSGTVVEAAAEAEEEQQLLPPHIHDYHWEAVTDPTIDQDGEMQYRCSCGDVKEKQPIPAAQIYMKGLYGAVKEAAPNGTVEYDAGKMHTISDYILNKISERSDVTVNVKFEYKGVKYQITFPAGTDYTKVLTDEPAMYGYFGVAAELGLAVTAL